MDTLVRCYVSASSQISIRITADFGNSTAVDQSSALAILAYTDVLEGVFTLSFRYIWLLIHPAFRTTLTRKSGQSQALHALWSPCALSHRAMSMTLGSDPSQPTPRPPASLTTSCLSDYGIYLQPTGQPFIRFKQCSWQQSMRSA